MTGSTLRSQPRVSIAGDTLIPRLPKKAFGAVLGAVVAGLALTAGQAKAIVVNVGGLDYDVTTFTGTYYGNEGKFALPAEGGQGWMPWYGSSRVAEDFVLAIKMTMGAPNGSSNQLGPYFAWATDFIGSPGCGRGDCTSGPFQDVRAIGALGGSPVGTTDKIFQYAISDRISTTTTWTWALATAVTPPVDGGGTGGGTSGGGDTGGTASVPGPLPILGVAAAFGFSRKLRNRIKLHKGTIDISTSTGA